MGGIQSVALLEKEWSKLVEYFTDFATRVDVLLGTPLNDFVKKANAQYDNELHKDLDAQFSKKLLFDLAYTTSVDAFKINKEAGAYHELSQEHFMPAVAILSELLSLDPENDENKIRQKHQEITQKQDAMERAIETGLRKKAEDFRTKIKARKTELKNLFNKEVYSRLPEELKEESKKLEEEAKEDIKRSKKSFEGFDF